MFKFLFQGSNLIARTAAQFAVVGMAGTIGVTVASTSASASLDAIAQNDTAQSIASGFLSLTQEPGGASVGFSSSFSDLAPGDTRYFYVNYINGTMPAENLTLSIAESNNNLLTRDGTKGLKVKIDECSVNWVSGACSGSQTSRLSYTALSSMNTTINSNLFATVYSGSTPANFTRRLKFTIILPDQTETTTNGVKPGSSIQGLSNGIFWTMRETQRASTDVEG